MANNSTTNNNSDLQREKDALLSEFLGSPSSENESSVSEESDISNSQTADNDSNISDFDNIDNNEPINSNSDDFKNEESKSKDTKDPDIDDFGQIDTLVIKASTPLPKYGKGFVFVPVIVVTTIIACVLGHIKPITYGIPSAMWVRYLYIGFGVIALFIGIKLIVEATAGSVINENLQMGKLVTTGIYSKTRNPIYGGYIFICTSALFFSGNAFMYALLIIYWVFLKEFMKKTEEVLLEQRFGDAYTKYRDKTNVFFPRNNH